MIQKISSILKRRNNLYVFYFFLLFFPIKTQLQNLVFFLFDYFFTNGTTTSLFTFNYRGKLMGCDAVASLKKIENNFNLFQQEGLHYSQFTPSLLAFSFLLIRWKNKLTFTLLDWVLTLVTCFSIMNAIEISTLLATHYYNFSSKQLIRFLPFSILFILIGSFIFFKIFNLEQKIQSIFIGIPTILISMILWFKFLGPKILPIVV